MSTVLSTIPLEQVRAETPGCAERIFLNNAGASLQPRSVVDRVIAHLRREEEIGGYEANDEAAAEHEQIYKSIATLLHAQPGEIALVESATRAWDMAFYGLPWRAGDVILTAPNEYASNYIAFLQVARRFDVRVVVVAADETGGIDLDALATALRNERQVALIALTHVPTNSGRVQPAAEVGRLAREHGVPFLLDACQSAGQIPLNVNELQCDMLSATGRKYLRGPRGTGFLYVRQSVLDRLDPPLLDLHASTWTAPGAYRMRPDARRFEAWESSVATRLGMGVAVQYALALGVDTIEARVRSLSARLREGVASVAGVTVQDPGWRDGAPECGIVTFTHGKLTVPEVVQKLAKDRIVVRVNDSAGALLDMRARGLEAVVRASVHYYNTEDEIDRCVSALGQLA